MEKYNNVKCVIKADDLRLSGSEAWHRFIDYSSTNSVPISVGLIGKSVPTKIDNELIKKISSSAHLIEIWNHGWHHSINKDRKVAEFYNNSLHDQIESIRLCQDACSKHFGVRPKTFGPPFNLFDCSTLAAVENFDELNCLFDVEYANDRYTLPKARYVECEGPATGRRFQLSKAIDGTNTFIEEGLDFVLQIHPGNHWELNCISEFSRYIQFLRANEVEIVLPQEHLNSRR